LPVLLEAASLMTEKNVVEIQFVVASPCPRSFTEIETAIAEAKKRIATSREL